MIDPIKSNATFATYQSNGSSQPISQELLNQLLMTSLSGNLILDLYDTFDTLMQKLKPLEPQVPGLEDLIEDLQSQSFEPQLTLYKITGAVAKAFIQSDTHMSPEEQTNAIQDIDKILSQPEPDHKDERIWNIQIVSSIISHVPGIIPDGREKTELLETMNKPPSDDPDYDKALCEVLVWSTNIAVSLAVNIPGALSDKEKIELKGLGSGPVKPLDDSFQEYFIHAQVWAARVYEKIEDTFFKN